MRKIIIRVVIAAVILLAGIGVFQWHNYQQKVEYRKEALLYFKEEDYSKTISYLGQALKLQSVFAGKLDLDMTCYLAESHYQLKEYDEANREFISLHNRIKGVNFYEVLYKTNATVGKVKEANAYLLYEFFENGYALEQLPLYQRLNEAVENSGNELLIKVVHSLIMSHLDSLVTRKSGKVVYYNEQNQFGNISVYDHDPIFFRQADFAYDEEVERNIRVNYTVLPTYDSKKQRLTEKAILVTIDDSDYDFINR